MPKIRGGELWTQRAVALQSSAPTQIKTNLPVAFYTLNKHGSLKVLYMQ